MAETLFTDIINNLGKAKKEGKISGGYRYKDGKLNIGGGYYGDDSMFEIDVNKDGGNILFKKRFADGGSTNGSGEKAFTAKVKELMDNGIEPYPSGDLAFDVGGGYPPNSHVCMPCELISDRPKGNARKAFQKLMKSRRNMKSLQTEVTMVARRIGIECICARIAVLPKILRTIEQNGGRRAKN